MSLCQPSSRLLQTALHDAMIATLYRHSNGTNHTVDDSIAAQLEIRALGKVSQLRDELNRLIPKLACRLDRERHELVAQPSRQIDVGAVLALLSSLCCVRPARVARIERMHTGDVKQNSAVAKRHQQIGPLARVEEETSRLDLS